MNLKELKKMIAEEYRYWMAEQPAPGAPGAPGEMGNPMVTPGVEVGPDDIMGGDDSEATLRQIYDMLKAYFEGGGAEAPAGAPAGDDMDMDMDMDMDAGDDMDMGDDAGDADDADDEVEEDKDDKDDKKESKKGKKESKKDKDALQERFQKLANIVKG